MNARILIPLAGVALLVIALWLVLGGDEDPGSGDAVGAADEPSSAPTSRVDEPRPAGVPEAARPEARPGTPAAPGSADPSPGSPRASARAADDDDSAVDPADRADADPTLVFSPDREGIQGAVNESLPQIKDCYEGWLQTRPDLSGRMLVQFLIAGNPEDPDFAEIRDVTLVDSELGHTLMEGCVASLFEELQFEAPDGGGEVKVNYPLRFTTDE